MVANREAQCHILKKFFLALLRVVGKNYDKLVQTVFFVIRRSIMEFFQSLALFVAEVGGRLIFYRVDKFVKTVAGVRFVSALNYFVAVFVAYYLLN